MNKPQLVLLRWITTLTLVCLPSFSHALSIGEITLNSGYAAPLNAQIAIPSYTREELDSLSATIAKPEAFEAAGLEWRRAFSGISLKLRLDDKDKPYILVTSIKEINDLTLSILVEFSWDGGRTVKQFDMLLSLLPSSSKAPEPTTDSNERQASVDVQQATEIERETQSIAPNLSVPRSTQTRTMPKASLEETGPGEYRYGPVLPGETLSNIAEKFAGKSSLGLNQRMRVLFQLNRNAFASEHLGSLKAGYYLRFSSSAQPTDEEPQDLSYEDNVDSPKQNGRVTREVDIKAKSQELDHLMERLEKTRGVVAGYRETNDELRSKLQELEKKVASQASELGVILPEEMIVPRNLNTEN